MDTFLGAHISFVPADLDQCNWITCNRLCLIICRSPGMKTNACIALHAWLVREYLSTGREVMFFTGKSMLRYFRTNSQPTLKETHIHILTASDVYDITQVSRCSDCSCFSVALPISN
jgi:hypothetical protein